MWALGFFSLGLGVGVVGALVGVGGGFILTPALLVLMPRELPSLVTATSLGVLWVNLAVSTAAYARLQRIDLRSGILFGCAALPGSVLGVAVNRMVGRGFFDLIFAFLLFGMAALLLRPPGVKAPQVLPRGDAPRGRRRLRDALGREYDYLVRERLGATVMAAIGFVASFFGLAGGSIITPLFIRFFGFPVHIGTATSIFAQLLLISAAMLTHLWAGNLKALSLAAAFMAGGVVVGAPLGARLSLVVRGVTIARLLAVLTVLVALQLLWNGLRAL